MVRDVIFQSIIEEKLDKVIYEVVYEHPEFRTLISRIANGYESMIPGSVRPEVLHALRTDGDT